MLPVSDVKEDEKTPYREELLAEEKEEALLVCCNDI
jgi:hypothetical protein